MKITKFKLIRKIYFGEEWYTDNASILTSFFTDDVGSREGSFIRFLEDPDDHATIRNYSCIIKDEDDILIGCQFDEDPYGAGIKMPRAEFISMLDQWHKLMKLRPQEIIVHKEGESYRLEGHEFPDKEKG